MPWWLAAIATVALVLVAAKAHGRQIRLEREQQGYFRVDFRAQNPAAVEAIWKRDRWTFWASFAVLFLSMAWAWGFWITIFLPAGIAFGLAFLVAGLASWVRLTRRKQGPLPWRKRSQAGSVGWWLAVAAAAALVALTVLV